MKFQIDPEFYDKVTKQIAQDNRELAAACAVKLLYHPMTLVCTFATLAAVGGALDGGTGFFVALIIGYTSSYIGIAAVFFLAHALMGDFSTTPEERYWELIWLMSKGYYLSSNEIDLMNKTAAVYREIKYREPPDDELAREMKPKGYTDTEIECFRRKFIPYEVARRGLGFSSAYKRNYDKIWRWNYRV